MSATDLLGETKTPDDQFETATLIHHLTDYPMVPLRVFRETL